MCAVRLASEPQPSFFFGDYLEVLRSAGAPLLATARAFCSGPRLHGAETDPSLQQGRTAP